MQQFLSAKSVVKEWQLAIEQCCDQLGNIPTDANLGFIYITDQHAMHIGDILRTLKNHYPHVDWVGSVGIAICSANTEYSNQAAIVMMVTDISREQYQLFTAPEELPALDKDTVQVAIVHGDPRNGLLAQTIENFATEHDNTYLIGGLSSARQHMYQIVNEVREGSLSGVRLSEEVAVITGLSQACSPIGAQHTLTKCENNIAVKVDNRPALDVLKEAMGDDADQDLQNIGNNYFFGFPIAESDTGDYIVRNIMGIDPNAGVIAVGGQLEEGTMIQFCERGDTTAEDDLSRMLEKLKKRSKNKIKGALYFTCLGRGMHMFGEQHKELELITEQLGDIPLVGFYANGEIAGNHLYEYTGVLLLFV